VAADSRSLADVRRLWRHRRDNFAALLARMGRAWRTGSHENGHWKIKGLVAAGGSTPGWMLGSTADR
jgi:hypothetical protein